MASTASNTLPPSGTAVHNAAVVKNATPKGVEYTIIGNTITGFVVRLKGLYLLNTTTVITTVAARFGQAADTPCALPVYDPTTGTTSSTCTGFSQPADRSWTLTVTVS